MRVIICGDRNWKDSRLMDILLCGLKHIWKDELHIIEGEAKGADQMAAHSAKFLVPPENLHKFPADWEKYGRAAGPIRNKQMLEEGKPDVVIGFHNDIQNSKGTKNMLDQAKAVGIPTYVISQW